MKKRNLFLGAAAMLLTALFSACSSDDPVPGTGQEDPVDDGGKVYMNIDITSTTANGSRSTTNPDDDSHPNVSSDGTEEGTSEENKISNIMVTIVGTKVVDNKVVDNCFIARWTKTFETKLSIDQAQNIKAEFSRSAFLTHFSSHTASDDFDPTAVRVYVICNYDEQIYGKVGTAGVGASLDWINAPESNGDRTKGIISNVKADGNLLSYSTPNNILMTNYQQYETHIPSQIQINNNEYNTADPGYDLTTQQKPILVERAVARFDYAHYAKKDATHGDVPEGNAVLSTDKKDVYYKWRDAQAADASAGLSAQPEIQVRIVKMALINMSKSFYLFRRVSDDGKPSGSNFAIGGREKDGGTDATTNYVVDPEWSFKSNIATATDEEYNSKFWWHLKNGSTTWIFRPVSDIIGEGEITNLDYKTCRYVTPNTIPGPNQQRAGISTGVVFRAQIKAADNNIGVGARMADGHDILVYGDKLLGSWGDIINLTKESNTSRDADLVAAFNIAKTKATSLGNESTWTGDNPQKTLNPNEVTAAVTAGFTIYSQETRNGLTGYFCDYYYWNRHNDNGNPSGMGPMEFGVVRNNVYKLAVTSIKRLGHPTDTSKDPDPVDPEDPDEESKLYMNVWVKVMPWVKRVNYIEF